jgi:hypothetical protein
MACLVPEMAIDQRHLGADFEQAQPGADVIRPVFHQQRHRRAASDSGAQRPVGIAIGACIKLGIAHRLILIEDRDVAGSSPGLRLDNVHDGTGRVRLDQPEQP